MSGLIRLDEDWQVSSTFSTGSATVEENVHAAELRNLKRLCVVDRVRESTEWVPSFVETVRAVDRKTRIDVSAGIEAEVLDTSGALDVPWSPQVADYVYPTIRRLPTPTGPMCAHDARERIASGRLLPARAIEWLVRATANAALRRGAVVLADPFNILLELGISERGIHLAYVRWLADALRERDASVVISERKRGPISWVIGCLMVAGCLCWHRPEASPPRPSAATTGAGRLPSRTRGALRGGPLRNRSSSLEKILSGPRGDLNPAGRRWVCPGAATASLSAAGGSPGSLSSRSGSSSEYGFPY
jgi:putative hydrolase